MPYYKATLAGGVSGYDKNFIYHLGLNVHPNPDKKSTEPCGVGLHLAKTPDDALSLINAPEELYEAEPGVILGEDTNKVRVAYCFLTKKIDHPKLEERRKEREKAEKQERLLAFYHKFGAYPPTLVGEEWLVQHSSDVTLEDWQKQTLVVSSGKHTVMLSPNRKPKEVREILAVI